MKIEHRDVGYGRYQWYLDGIEYTGSEVDLLQAIEEFDKNKADELHSRWTRYTFYVNIDDSFREFFKEFLNQSD